VVGCSGVGKDRATAPSDRLVERLRSPNLPGVDDLVQSLVLSLTEEQIKKANQVYLADPTTRGTRGGPGQGLPYSGLSSAQQRTIQRLWQIWDEGRAAHPDPPEIAARLRAPGPIESTEILNVGYCLVPEERKDQTMLRFTAHRSTVATDFDTILPRVVELPPALSRLGIDFGKTGAVKVWLKAPPDVEEDMARAEEEAKKHGGHYPPVSPGG